MSDFGPLYAQAAQQYNLDPNILKSLVSVESGGNPNALNPTTGASGLLQFIPATAKAYGIDPTNPAQAINAGAQMFRQNLDRFNGDVSSAVAAHFAGPDQAQWGPKTSAYVQKVATAFNGMQNNTGAPPVTNTPATNAPANPSVDAWLGKPQAQAPATAQSPDVGAWLGQSANGTPAAPPPAPAPAPDSTPWGEAMRQLGLTVRAGVTGLTSLPTMAGDAVNSGINLGIKGVNAVAGTHINPLQMPSQIVQNTMNAAGVPQPQNATERVVQDATGALAGVSPFVGAGGLLAKAASPVVQAVGQGMQAMPGMQMTGAAGSAIGGGVARENGAGAQGQIGASIVGGLLGAVAPSAAIAGARGAQNMASLVKPWTNPQGYVGQQLAQRLGPDAAAVADNISNAPQFVPGSFPTTAQAGANPLLVQTEKAFANANPDFKNALAARSAGNNSARWVALDGVSMTPADLQAAQEARTAITAPAYAAAHANTANVGAAFMRYAQIPEMQEAMASANKLATLDAAVGRGVPPVWPTPDSKMINGAALDYTSRALGDMIGAAKQSGATTKAGALSVLKNNVDDWMGRYIPGVADARNDYAALSSPINTMQAGQQIAANVGTRALDVNGLPNLTLSGYRGALTSAIKNQPFGIDQGAHATLQGIGQDLQRASISNSLGSPGSDTTYNIAANGWLGRQLYGNNFGGATGLGKVAGAVAATATGHPYIGLGLLSQGNKLGQMAGARLNAQLSDLMLNPSGLLPYLAAAVKQGAKSPPPSLGGNVAQGLLGAATAVRPSP